MDKGLNNGFCVLSQQEELLVDGGGLVTLFFSCVGLAISPAVACLNPLAGAGLALTTVGLIEKNWPN